MYLVDVVSVLEEFFFERMDAANVCGGRIFPVIAPSGTPTPFVTHDIKFGSSQGPVKGTGHPETFDMEWEITTWIDGFDRQPLRAEWRTIFAALLGEADDPGKPRRPNITFTSDEDGSEWDITLLYGEPRTPPAVDSSDEGQWIRIQHSFIVHATQRSDGS